MWPHCEILSYCQWQWTVGLKYEVANSDFGSTIFWALSSNKLCPWLGWLLAQGKAVARDKWSGLGKPTQGQLISTSARSNRLQHAKIKTWKLFFGFWMRFVIVWVCICARWYWWCCCCCCCCYCTTRHWAAPNELLALSCCSTLQLMSCCVWALAVAK